MSKENPSRLQVIKGAIDQAAARGQADLALPGRNGEMSAEEGAELTWSLFQEYAPFRRRAYREWLRGNMGKISEEERGNGGLKRRIARRKELQPAALAALASREEIRRAEKEIASLWQDEEVRDKVLSYVSRVAREEDSHSAGRQEYLHCLRRHQELILKRFELLGNKVSFRKMMPRLRLLSLQENRRDLEAVKAKIEELEKTGGMPEDQKRKRGGLDKEHADAAALFSFERIEDYCRQYEETGFILLPSRLEMLMKCMVKAADGTWLALIGETGTGKTTIAKEIARVLTGKEPCYASGGKRIQASALIGKQTIDSHGSYFLFGPLAQALTGCSNSLEMAEAIKEGRSLTGRLCLLDELNLFDQEFLFEVLKIAHALRPGELFTFKELPGVQLKMAEKGFILIGTLNPSSVRYERKPLDPAIDREFINGKMVLGYPILEEKSPELYEMLLAMLMDKFGGIPIAKEELSPVWESIEDVASGEKTEILAGNVKKHGALYRFALGVAEVQKSFSYQESVASSASDKGFLERTVLDMRVLSCWMKGYYTEAGRGVSLGQYLLEKLQEFYGQIESEHDRVIFRKIFDHFDFSLEQLVDQKSSAKAKKPVFRMLTPIEIGYLSPATSRAVLIKGEEAKPNEELKLLIFDDGEEVFLLETDIAKDGEKILSVGEIVTIDGKEYQFYGHDEQGMTIFVEKGKKESAAVIRLEDPEVAKKIDAREIIIEKPNPPPAFLNQPDKPISVSPENPGPSTNPVEMMMLAEIMLGEDFFGPEAIKKMQDKLNHAGVQVEFPLDEIPPLTCSEKDLQWARDHRPGERLILRRKKMRSNGIMEEITPHTLQRLFERAGFLGQKKGLFNSSLTNSRFGLFSKAEIRPGWVFVSKEALPEATDKGWPEQDQALKCYQEEMQRNSVSYWGVDRRSLGEVFWDWFLFATSSIYWMGKGGLYETAETTRTKEDGTKIVLVDQIKTESLLHIKSEERIPPVFSLYPFSVFPQRLPPVIIEEELECLYESAQTYFIKNS